MKKVIVAIGGSGALGRSVTTAFLEQDAQLVIGWADGREWEQFAQDFSQAGDAILGLPVDVTDERSVSHFFHEVLRIYGRIDALIYLAGIFSIGPETWNADIAQLTKMIAVNTIGAVTACKYAVPAMLQQGCGNIIFMPAKSVLVGTAHFGMYAVSKGALIPLMETLTEELKETGIAVNCVMPDAMITPITRRVPNAPLDKWVTTQDVAEIIVSVCMSKGNIVRGSVLKCFGK